jgi:predicted acylesterase/phospholipase RssA
VVTGISAGSINAIATIGWAIGDEFAATEWGSDLWNNLTNSTIWKLWPEGLVQGFLNEAGAFDDNPLREYLVNVLSEFDGEFKRRISVGTVDANTGDYWLFTQNNTEFYDFAKAAASSASIPGAFPPYVWEGKGVFIDGSTNKNIELTSMIDQCLEIVDSESKIVADVLICDPPEGVPDEGEIGTTIPNWLRNYQLGKAEHASNSLDYMMRAHPDVTFRYVVH